MSFVYWELIASKYQARILPQVFWALKFSITDKGHEGRNVRKSWGTLCWVPSWPCASALHLSSVTSILISLTNDPQREKEMEGNIQVKRECKTMSTPCSDLIHFFKKGEVFISSTLIWCLFSCPLALLFPCINLSYPFADLLGTVPVLLAPTHPHLWSWSGC